MNGEKLWKVFQRWEADAEAAAGDETSSPLPRAGMSRRTFIELIGFSAAALAFSSCRPPEQKIIPYLNQPVELTPGVANWYASTCGGCRAACGVLVKVRDGRPIKLEGNPQHPLTEGGLCAVAHAMVFDLYDAERLRQPMIGSQGADWEEVDRQIIETLTTIKQSGGAVRLLSSTINSPTSREVIARFLNQFADGRHIVYEPVSTAAISQAHQKTHGVAVVPNYRLDKARLIISFGADFLGTWLAPVQFTRQYARARNLQDGRREMLRHIQFESRLSLTGINADARVRVSPAEEIAALLLLAKRVAEKRFRHPPAELRSLDETQLPERVRDAVERAARQVWQWPGRSLVISGSNDVDVQCVVNFINHLTGAYGQTVDLRAPTNQNQASDGDMVQLVKEMNEGKIAALLMVGVNPAYDYYAREDFIRGLSNVPVKISFSPRRDETSALVDYICPHHHFLETWDDAEPVPGVFSLNQPTIAPLFQTRAYQESLLRWSGDERSYYEVLRQHWREHLFPRQNGTTNFDEFWDRSLQDGVVVLTSASASTTIPRFTADEVGAAVRRLRARSTEMAESLSVILYESVALRDGAHASNPWLHELPDPITKVTWDNYASLSPKLAEQWQLEEGRVIRLSKGEVSLELPVLIQPGQDDRTIAIALGYGRTKAGRGGSYVGVNAYPLVSFERGTFQYLTHGITIEKTPHRVEFASTQRHHTLDGRPLIKELTLAEYLAEDGDQDQQRARSWSIWEEYPYGEHKWAMVVDLNACTGCSACILSCQAENNVPVVGKDLVRERREMHWIRLDRYYRGEADDPTVSYLPVMCYQCDNASCESVCPVLATVHSSEGLNMQVYNRCVGTRYCENNCPYKVRRFNWFQYPHSDPIANLALNPDVTVRTRGVMEKCTFCIQRIEEAKIRARNEGRPLKDGEIQTACQQSCPAGAIIFGDLVDRQSRVARLRRDKRGYVLLEELNRRPNITYLARVRNREEA